MLLSLSRGLEGRSWEPFSAVLCTSCASGLVVDYHTFNFQVSVWISPRSSARSSANLTYCGLRLTQSTYPQWDGKWAAAYGIWGMPRWLIWAEWVISYRKQQMVMTAKFSQLQSDISASNLRRSWSWLNFKNNSYCSVHNNNKLSLQISIMHCKNHSLQLQLITRNIL